MSADPWEDYCFSFHYCMYGSDVDSINVDLEFFQSGDILTVPLLHLAPNQDEGEIQDDNEQKIGPVWELAQLSFRPLKSLS